MVLDSKSTIKSLRGEYKFRKTVITVAIYTASLFTVASLTFGIVQNTELLTFFVLIAITAILAVELLVYKIRPYIQHPILRMQKMEKRLSAVNKEVEKREKYLKDLQVSAFGLAKYVKQENIETILSKISNVVGVENVNLWLSSGTDLVLAADWGADAKSPASLKIPLSEKSGAAYSFKTGKTIVSKDASKDSRLNPMLVKQYSTRNLVCTPLKIGNDVIGILVAVNKKQGIFTRFDVNYLKGTAYPLATAIQNANLASEINKRLEEERYFITDLAHNLKTPLTSVRGELELAARGHWKKLELTQTITQAVSTIEQISKTLERSMRLAYYEMKGESGKEFDLEKVTNEVFEVSNLVASQKDIKFSYKTHGAVKVLGEEQRISQAILCILDNAIKYTPNGGRVDLSLAKKNDMAEIIISDSGYGIEKEDIDMIFKRFWKGKVADDDGTGLGLSIANSIVSAHGGQIKVKSQKNQGTTFTILLPLVGSNIRPRELGTNFSSGQNRLFTTKPALNN